MSKEKIVENVGTVSDKLVQYMDAAEQVITQYGGDAVNLGLNVLRIEAGQHILTGIIFIVVAVILYKIIPKSSKSYGSEIDKLIVKGYYKRGCVEDSKVREATGSDRTSYLGTQWNEPYAFIPAALSVISVIVSAASLLNVWNWIGVFWPQAYAVHKFLM